MAKIHYLTAEGLEKLKAEHSHLVSVERPAISRQIAEARDKGDLSENAEYDAAKEAQGLLELKIAKLEDMIANARIIDESKINTTHIQILNKVKLKNLNNNTVVEYILVGETEANLMEGKLAAATPIGKALIGKAKGDVVEVNVPSGILKFEILEISK
jgi:transcription elongation factor GreA